jgi:hypothetical protein
MNLHSVGAPLAGSRGQEGTRAAVQCCDTPSFQSQLLGVPAGALLALAASVRLRRVTLSGGGCSGKGGGRRLRLDWLLRLGLVTPCRLDQQCVSSSEGGKVPVRRYYNSYYTVHQGTIADVL